MFSPRRQSAGLGLKAVATAANPKVGMDGAALPLAAAAGAPAGRGGIGGREAGAGPAGAARYGQSAGDARLAQAGVEDGAAGGGRRHVFFFPTGLMVTGRV